MLPLLTLVPLACGLVARPSSEPVTPGIDRFSAGAPQSIKGRRVGLITNHTGIARNGTSSIDILAASRDVRLVALFSPEHGIRGVAGAGERIASGLDERTGLPIHSLYGETRKPTREMLAGVEALVFDVQDVGARPYTYVYTMALGMQAAREVSIPFVVLDRPNPIGGTEVEGNLLDPAFGSFVGMYAIPMRHGMTAGELASLFNSRFGIGAELVVVPMKGWSRERWYDETGLPWVNPSPNIRSLDAAIHYPGTVLLEGTNLSEGRGSDRPFEQTGAPWLDAAVIAAEMNRLLLPGIRFEAVRFPVATDARKYGGHTLPGVRLVLVDRESYRPVRTTVLLIDAIRRRHPDRFAWTASMDRLAGTDRLRSSIEAGSVSALLAEWDADAERFHRDRQSFLLYD